MIAQPEPQTRNPIHERAPGPTLFMVQDYELQDCSFKMVLRCVRTERRTDLHWLLQHAAANGTKQILIYFPLEPGDVVPHGTLLERSHTCNGSNKNKSRDGGAKNKASYMSTSTLISLVWL